MKLLHAMIRVKDIDASMRFYTELLGLKKVKQIKLEDSFLHYISDGSGSFQIELTQNFETPKNGYECGNCFGHFALETENMDAFTEKLKSLGYEYLYEPFMLEEAEAYIAFIKDPDGIEIEIIEKKQGVKDS
jgi:lactoylglutathione lyase